MDTSDEIKQMNQELSRIVTTDNELFQVLHNDKNQLLEIYSNNCYYLKVNIPIFDSDDANQIELGLPLTL